MYEIVMGLISGVASVIVATMLLTVRLRRRVPAHRRQPLPPLTFEQVVRSNQDAGLIERG